ncbi:MAG: hypothetical protein DMG00_23040 [Acidobacteria bacterium]|nr:MAG: hypothetical protein DMG00_23040 [Acidobacteriota bacterium]
MAEPQQLTNPPITEALVDIRIAADQKIDPGRLQPLRSQLAHRYPTFDEKKQFQAEFRVDEGKLVPSPLAVDLGFQGLWLTSADGARIAQFRPNGFTFNNVGLGKYVGGEALLAEALELWSRFFEIVMPATVVRLALRYLNRLDLPFREGDDFGMYLTEPPRLSEGAPQKISAFLSRIVAHDDTGANAIVTQKMDHTGKFPVEVVVDVDVFFVQELDPSIDNLRGFLEILRSVKNRTFFALLTQEAVKLWL